MLAQSQYPRLIAWLLELFHRRVHYEKVTMINGLRVQICPQVFNPILGQTTSFFIRHMKLKPRRRVLEIGTGSGAIAAAAAQITQPVTATDISPLAVQCAQATLRLNGIESRVRVLLGDLFSPVKDETFDIILFNPPYFRFDAQSWMAKGWCAGSKYELFDQFLSNARQVLAKNGEIQMLLSSAALLPRIISLTKNVGFKIQIIAKGRIFGLLERIYLFRLL